MNQHAVADVLSATPTGGCEGFLSRNTWRHAECVAFHSAKVAGIGWRLAGGLRIKLAFNSKAEAGLDAI